MSDSDRPDVDPHDDQTGQRGGLPDGQRPGPEADDLAAVEADEGSAPAPRRRVPWSPWWRLAAAAAAVGGLTWAATATDATLDLAGEPRADAAGMTAEPGAGTFVDAAVLACPGPVPWTGETPDDRPRVQVLAAGAPQSVLDSAPPSVADDAAASTAAPDGAATTAPADDDAATTAGPDDATTTAQPPTSDDASLLRTTGTEGSSTGLQHGRPNWFVVEEPAAVVVDAAGSLAPGLAGGQLGLGTEPGSRGLTVSGCAVPGEVQWLVGGGSAPGRSEQLVLTNPGPDAITVDVSVWGADGPVETTGASGIVVPGDGRVVELLDAVAPGVDAPVVSVASTGGPVVAHLAESFREGTTDRGAEVVPAVAPPATDLVVPALPAAPEGHDARVVLRVAAPGEAEAVVDVTALTPEGAVRLTDLVTRVPAGHTVDVELDQLPEGATALRLRSDEPVTAGARLEVLPAEDEPEVVETTPDDASATQEPDPERTEQGEPLLRAAGDLAWVGATAPSTAPTGMALPERRAVPRGSASLALTAVDGTTAWLTWTDAQGGETSRAVELPHDTTVLVDVPAEARMVWVVGAGPAGVVSALHVTGSDERGPFVAATTVPDLPWLRSVTQVRAALP